MFAFGRPRIRFLHRASIAALFGAVAAGRGEPAPLPVRPDIVVAADGSGDFRTVQAAVQSVARENRERTIILLKDGVYREKVRIDAAAITLRGESRRGTRIEFAQGADEFRAQPDRIGNAVLNLGADAHDSVIENLTVENTHGVLGRHAFAIFGLADRTVIVDCDVYSQGNDTLSLWRGRAENAAAVADASSAGDGQVWREAGRYYHARLNVRGSVDFICPRGWCYLADSTITQVNPGATAAVWHDGSNNPDKKFVLRRCRFDGPPDWYLARRHHDGQFFFIDCSFSQALRDRAPYRVTYPLGGGTPTPADIERNTHYDRTNVYGDRNYYFNSHREGGDYAWHRDNLQSAPGSPTPEQITAAWTFAGSWNPERTDPPRVRSVRLLDRAVEVTFTEAITVKGTAVLAWRNGERTALQSGSGSRTLTFAKSARSTEPAAVEVRNGAIVASEAGATLRVAVLSFP